MSQETIKIYDPAHKGLRNAMSLFQLKLGNTDFKSKEDVSHLKSIGHELFILLDDHIKNENEYVLPFLESKCEGASKHDLDDHHHIEILEKSLQNKLLQLDGTQTQEWCYQFYLEFTKYHAIYLEHILEEELVTEPLIHQHCSPEDIMDVLTKINTGIKPDVLFLWFKYIVPARSLEDNISVLKPFKAAVPTDFFEIVMNHIKQFVPEIQYQKLVDRLK